jgi:hypothetical protein
MKRIISSIIIFVVCLGLLIGCEKHQSDLITIASQIKSITVYDLEGLSGPKYTKQDLDNSFQASFNPKLFRELAPEARFKDKWVLWKGSRLAVVELNDGTKIQLALSYYGGFFKILGEYGYFYFEDEAREKWVKAFSKDILQDIFIPKRIERNKRQEEGKS